MSTHNLCFEQKYEKYQNFYLKILQFLVVKFSIYFVMNLWISLNKEQNRTANDNFRETS